MQEAYEVLSNPQERAYYDDNREHVLGSDEDEEEEDGEAAAELDSAKWCSREAWVDFTWDADGFFAVYSSVFRDLHEQAHPPHLTLGACTRTCVHENKAWRVRTPVA